MPSKEIINYDIEADSSYDTTHQGYYCQTPLNPQTYAADANNNFIYIIELNSNIGGSRLMHCRTIFKRTLDYSYTEFIKELPT